uniref:Uncharacterized protein n=1 Tax=Magallana gigas TaxID=29159 RepID=A0A8W8NIA9_MAGGI
MVDSATQTENTAQRTTDGYSQTDRNHLQNSSDHKCIQSDPADLSAVSSKLDEILSILKRKKEPMNVSDVLRWVTSTTSTTLPGMQSVTIVPVEEDSILGAREPTSPVLNRTGRCARGREVYTENIVSVERTPFAGVTHKVLNKKTTGSKDKVLTFECRPTSTTIEIKDKCDIVYGEFEFRVRRDILSDLKEASCSDGNFMWLLAKTLP